MEKLASSKNQSINIDNHSLFECTFSREDEDIDEAQDIDVPMEKTKDDSRKK